MTYADLVVGDWDEEIILLFKTVEEREGFDRLMRGISSYMANVPSGEDAAILKSFLRADVKQSL